MITRLFACSILLTGGAGHGVALPVQDPLGKWRFSPEASCGIDDVRANNLLTVTGDEIRYRAVTCVRIPANASTAPHEVSVAGLCEIGGEDPLPVTFHWRFTPGAPALLSVQGYEQPVYHCSETQK